jgi:RNA polymerase sigma-54 factor
MRLSFGQHLQQKQTQILAPRMIQSMEILQLPVTALLERVEQELRDNPVLEVSAADPELPEEAYEREPTASADTKELVVDQSGNNVDDFERLVELDRDVPDHFEDRPRVSSNRMQDASDLQHDLMANVEDRPESLHAYLLHQLHEIEVASDLLAMCERIISTLNPSTGGYLRVSLEDLLPADHSPETLQLARRALALIQTLDPPGIAARDLRECLLLQIDDSLPMRDEVRCLVNHHLEDLRDNRIPQIQKSTGYSYDQIMAAWDQLRKLNPKPASRFSSTRAPAISPDVIVHKDADGRYRVQAEEAPIGNLYISNYYKKRHQSGQLTADEREFLKKKYASAKWLLEAIEQRRNTVARVAQEIVDHQKAFLDKGPEYLVPLKMQQIADRVGVHVTTVSRAVDDKWMDTPRGLIPMKRFFVGGTQTEDGEDVAWDRVQIELKKLVDSENKSDPLSDEHLCNELRAMGFDVARRTIAKYRKKLGILSSRQRRDWSKDLS